jgi:glycosyltransferase involved in cell wall biosynthesis
MKLEIYETSQMKNSLRLLWLNWRDIKNPDAGGAEVFTHEVTRRLSKKGYDITLFTARFPNSLKREEIDGVKIVRDGGKYTVYNKARNHYKIYKQDYDIIIDEINTRPFLTPKFVKDKPILAVFHQLAAQFWFYETFFPLNYLGYYYLEKKWLSYYRNVPVITVSNSSKHDLCRMGLKNIFIVPEGLNVTPLLKVRDKGKSPIVVFIGRLKKAKLPDHAIEAFRLIKEEIKDAEMWIIGTGYLRDKLQNSKIKDTLFYGNVNDDIKYDLLSKAHLVLVPAVREGWGLVVTESNAMGTPAVAYNVPGLRDSIKDGITGILTKENNPHALSKTALSLLNDRDLLYRLSCNALEYSRQFSWENTAQAFDTIIRNNLISS